MSDYTPTTEDIRRYFPSEPSTWVWLDSEWRPMDRELFDRWLAEHDREVKAEAWDEGYSVDRRFNAPTPNPYREVSNE